MDPAMHENPSSQREKPLIVAISESGWPQAAGVAVIPETPRLPAPDPAALRSALERVLERSPACILVDLHVRPNPGTRREDLEGFKILDELLLAAERLRVRSHQLDFSPPPMLLLSPLSLAQLVPRCERRLDLARPYAAALERLKAAKLDLARIVCRIPEVFSGPGLDCAIEGACRSWREGGIRLDELLQDTARAYIEAMHCEWRHVHFQAEQRAVARLLLGAELCLERSVVQGHTRKLLRKLSNGILTRLLVDPEYESLLEVARRGARPARFDELKLLVVDDHCGDWQDCLVAVSAGRIRCEARKEPPTVAARNGASEDLRQFDAVLLDYDLGPHGTSGDWLRKSRSQFPDVPVVMFTASDRVDLALWCLQHGAVDYFVKEPFERSRRGGREHLLRLLGLLRAFNDLERFSGLWKRDHAVRKAFVTYASVQDRLQTWGRLHPRRGALIWHLQQFFREILANRTDFYLGGATELRPVREARLGYHLEVAFELLADLVWSPALGKAIDSSSRGWANKWRFLLRHCSDALPKALVRKMQGAVNNDRLSHTGHWKVHLSPRTQRAVPAIVELLAPLGALLRETSRLPQFRPPAVAPQSIVDPAVRSRGRTPAASGFGTAGSHGATQEMGARELLAGFLQACGADQDEELRQALQDFLERPEIRAAFQARSLFQLPGLRAARNRWAFPGRPFRLLIVDDRPDSAYIRALELLLRCLWRIPSELVVTLWSPAPMQYAPVEPEHATSSTKPLDLRDPSRQALQEFDLVLLDLDHGGTARPEGDTAGLEWLRRLRNEGADWSVPVALVTSRTDALELRQALALGASEYLPKRILSSNPGPSVDYTLGRLARLCTLALHPLRQARSLEEHARDELCKPWDGPWTGGGKPLAAFRTQLRMGGGEPVDSVREAVLQAVLAAIAHLNLHATRGSRADLWLEDVFDHKGAGSMHVAHICFELGCAVEPLILCMPLLFETVNERMAVGESPTAGAVLYHASAAIASAMPQNWLKVVQRAWNRRNDAEHGKPGRELLDQFVRDPACSKQDAFRDLCYGIEECVWAASQFAATAGRCSSS